MIDDKRGDADARERLWRAYQKRDRRYTIDLLLKDDTGKVLNNKTAVIYSSDVEAGRCHLDIKAREIMLDCKYALDKAGQ